MSYGPRTGAPRGSFALTAFSQRAGSCSPSVRRSHGSASGTRAGGDSADPTGISEKCLQCLLAAQTKEGLSVTSDEPTPTPPALDDDARPAKRRRPKLISFAEVEAKEVDWLWPGYIPKGMLTLISGDPGGGKSHMTLAIAAALSCGRSLPGMSHGVKRKPLRSLILNAEDDRERVIKPRLNLLAACDKHIVTPERYFTFDEEGVRWLDEMLAEAKPAFVVIDPIVAYLGGAVDMHRANQVRAITTQIAELANKHHSAIVLVRHLRKTGGKAIYAGQGSIDFTGIVRSELLTQQDKAAKERVLAHIKCNVGPLAPSLTYELGAEGFTWGDQVNVTGDELMADADERAQSTERAEAMEIMRKSLGHDQWVRTNELFEKVQSQIEVSKTTLDRAKAALKREGLRVEQKIELGDGWFNCMPGSEKCPAPQIVTRV